MADTLRLVYLGWQGWLVGSGETNVMIDGLLLDEVGRGRKESRLNFHFDPPRQTDWAACPPLSAYVVTHEHEDHFNIPSLARLSRKIPLLASARLSAAGRELLGEMGFSISYVYPGDAVAIGPLSFRFFSGELSPSEETDEWDTIGFLVRPRNRRVAFFSNVDANVTDEMRRCVDEIASDGVSVAAFVGMELFKWVPGAELAVGNHHRIPRDRCLIREQTDLNEYFLSGKRFILRPGEALVLRDDAWVYEPHCGFVAPKAQCAPVLRKFRKGANEDIAEPACGKPEFDVSDIHLLERALDELAAYLYGRRIFRRLYSIRLKVERLRPTFVIVFLLNRRDRVVYEYLPHCCSFRRCEGDGYGVERRYCGAVLMWATDFLSMVNGEIEPRTLGNSLDETWVFPGLSLWTQVFWCLYHPQRFPTRVLDQYRRQLADESTAPVLLRAATYDADKAC